MILAAGLTPAWQQIVVLEELRVGEVNRAREVHWCASGKVLNVGIALAHLGCFPPLPRGEGAAIRLTGVSSRTLSLVGGTAQLAIEREFRTLNVDARWVTSMVPTRVCTTILDRATGATTELVENAQPIPPDELAEFARVYAEESARAEIVVLTGSLPAGTPASYYRDLLANTPGRVVLDVRGDALLASLEHKPFVVKPNREELGQTLKRPIDTDADLLAAMRELNERGAEWVVISQGKDAVWISSASECFRAQPPTVKVVNPIGCGDCLAAGIAWAVANGHPLPEAVRFGIAAAADNVQQLLPARLDPARVSESATRIDLTRITPAP